MSAHDIAIRRTGLVTAVGLSAPESCAAFRAKINNPSETRFTDSGGDWIAAHQVQLSQPWRGVMKLAKMAALAIDEALNEVPGDQWKLLPLLLCVAEPERPGRTEGLDEQLFGMVERELDTKFAPQSAVIAQGRVGVAVALVQARSLIANHDAAQVLIAAVDSLLSWPSLSHYERNGRLLSARNSNGFIPGEGAGALLLAANKGEAGQLVCGGIGFGHETANIESEEPLRGTGLAQAIKASLLEAGSQLQDFEYRIADVSGEHYYFKEAALALSRILRVRKEEFDIWHPAECTGEIGAASGVSVIAAAHAACEKGYAKGTNVLTHWSNDTGRRAAVALKSRSAT